MVNEAVHSADWATRKWQSQLDQAEKLRAAATAPSAATATPAKNASGREGAKHATHGPFSLSPPSHGVSMTVSPVTDNGPFSIRATATGQLEIVNLVPTKDGFDLDLLVRDDERKEYWPLGMFLKDRIDRKNAAHEIRKMIDIAVRRAPPATDWMRQAIADEIQHIQRQFESLGTVNDVTAEKILRPSFERVLAKYAGEHAAAKRQMSSGAATG